jgi:hypothetical protein
MKCIYRLSHKFYKINFYNFSKFWWRYQGNKYHRMNLHNRNLLNKGENYMRCNPKKNKLDNLRNSLRKFDPINLGIYYLHNFGHKMIHLDIFLLDKLDTRLSLLHHKFCKKNGIMYIQRVLFHHLILPLHIRWGKSLNNFHLIFYMDFNKKYIRYRNQHMFYILYSNN